jgi:WD40 repeat protein
LEIKAHDSKVTSLLVLYNEDLHMHCLVSGSSDSSLKVWNLTNGILIEEFFYHSGSITAIFTPPNIKKFKNESYFCSVGEDRSVCLYSLNLMECVNVFGGHSSSVVSVDWRIDVDSLLIRCSDGSLYIWVLNI